MSFKHGNPAQQAAIDTAAVNTARGGMETMRQLGAGAGGRCQASRSRLARLRGLHMPQHGRDVRREGSTVCSRLAFRGARRVVRLVRRR